MKELFAGFGEALPLIDLTAESAWNEQPVWNPEADCVGLTSRHLAYVIYTLRLHRHAQRRHGRTQKRSQSARMDAECIWAECP